LCPCQTERVLCTFLAGEDFLEYDLMLPIIPKIVFILHSHVWSREIIRNREVPTRQGVETVVPPFIVRDADVVDLPRCLRIADTEQMKVVVLPAHGILYRYMKVPETVGFGNLDSSPDLRLNPLQTHLELVNSLESSHRPLGLANGAARSPDGAGAERPRHRYARQLQRQSLGHLVGLFNCRR